MDVNSNKLVDEVYSARRIYWPAYTWPTQTSYSRFITENESTLQSRLSGVSRDVLINHVSDLFDKINATFYHLQQVKILERKAVEMGMKLAAASPIELKGFIGVVGLYYEPTQYEYEALIITAKTAMDILTVIIAESIGRTENNIVSLLHNLNQTEKLSRIEARLKVVLNKSSTFIDSFSRDQSKRNYAAHNGSLPIGTINVPTNNPKAPIIKSKAHDHRKSIHEQMKEVGKAPDLEDYCETTFYSMAEMSINCLEILLDTTFKKGLKMSVQDESMRQ